MTPHPAPLPGLDGEPGAGPAVVRCRECDRPLTGQQARRRGVGDGCLHKTGWRNVHGPGRFQVEQETLPEG